MRNSLLAIALTTFGLLAPSASIAAEPGPDRACGDRKRRIDDAEFFDPYKLSPQRGPNHAWRVPFNGCRYQVGGAPGMHASTANLRALMSKKDHDDCLDRMNMMRRKEATDDGIVVGSELKLATDAHRDRALKGFGVEVPSAKTNGFWSTLGSWATDMGKSWAQGKLPASDLVLGLGGALLQDNCTDAQTQINQAALPFLVAKGGRFVYRINLREGMTAGNKSVVYEALVYEVKVGHETRSIPIWGAILPVHIQ